MAFNGKNDNIKTALQAKPTTNTAEPPADVVINIPNLSKVNEKKKNFTFTLKPSLREKLDTVSKEKGFRSSSELIEYLIENL